jgi:preprotein translocase subunit SecF
VVRVTRLTDIPDMFPDVDYTKYTNRQLALVPLVVLGIALAILVSWSLFMTGSVAEPGAPVNLGIEFTKGSEIQITANDSPAEIKQNLDFAVESVQPVRGEDAYIVTTQSTDSMASSSVDWVVTM